MFEAFITLEQILSKVNEEQIWQYYLNINKIIINKAIYKNKLRTDNNGSCYFTYPAKQNSIYKYRFTDKAFGLSLSFVDYVMLKYKITFKKALLKIFIDFNLLEENSINTINMNKEEIEEIKNIKPLARDKFLDYKIKYRDWNEEDTKYWATQGLKIKDLINIKPIHKIYLFDKIDYNYNKFHPCYVYIFGKDKFKFYFPLELNKKLKFRQNSSNIEGALLLNKNEIIKNLIITKSYKEVLFLKKYNYKSIASSSEGTIITESQLEENGIKYENLYLFLDNDEAGIKNSEKYTFIKEENKIFIPMTFKNIFKKRQVKDITELYECYGETVIKNFLKFYLPTP